MGDVRIETLGRGCDRCCGVFWGMASSNVGCGMSPRDSPLRRLKQGRALVSPDPRCRPSILSLEGS